MSRILCAQPQTTHVALPQPKLSCGVKSQMLSTVPSLIKIGSGGQNLPFSYTGYFEFVFFCDGCNSSFRCFSVPVRLFLLSVLGK